MWPIVIVCCLLTPLLLQAQNAWPDTMGHLAMVQRVVQLGLVMPQDEPFRLRLSLQYVGPDSAQVQRAFFQDPHQVTDFPRGWLRTGEVFTIELLFRHKDRVGFIQKPLSIQLSDGTWTVVQFRGRYATPEVMDCIPSRQLPLLGEVHDPDSLAQWRSAALAIDSLLVPDSLCPDMDVTADLTFLFTAVRGSRWYPVSGPYGMTSSSEPIDQIYLGDGATHVCCGQRWLDGLAPEEAGALARRHARHELMGPDQSYTQLSADGRYVVLVQRYHFSQFLSGTDVQRRVYFRREGGT